MHNVQGCLRTLARFFWLPTFLPPLCSALVLEEMLSASPPHPRQRQTLAIHCKAPPKSAIGIRLSAETAASAHGRLSLKFNSIANTIEWDQRVQVEGTRTRVQDPSSQGSFAIRIGLGLQKLSQGETWQLWHLAIIRVIRMMNEKMDSRTLELKIRYENNLFPSPTGLPRKPDR